MAQTIKIKRSATSGNKLTGSNSIAGEIGMNTADKSLYIQTGSTDASVVTVYDDSILHLDDTNNRVGIGTTSPTHNLHIQNSGAAAAIKLRRDDSAKEMLILVGSGYGYVQNTTGPLGLGGSNNDRDILIDTSGRVGIGKTSPGTKLHIADSATPVFRIEHTGGTARYVDVYNSGGAMYLRARNDTANGNIVFQGHGGGTNTEYARFQGTGNMGIGTTSPQARLHIHNSGTGSGDHAYAHFTTGDTGSGSSDGLTIGVAADANAAINFRESSGALKIIAGNEQQFHTGGSERLRVTSTGIVSIYNSSNSTVPTNGALRITGGLGVGYNVHAGGLVRANSGFYVNTTQIVDSSRNLVNIGTISSGAITSGAITASDSLASSTPLTIGSSSQTSFTYQQWKTSAHGAAEAYIIAYGAGHSTQSGNFAMKNLEPNSEIFFELAGSVEPLRFASNGAATFNKAFTFPTTDGSANQILQTDGSGNVSWASVSGAGGTSDEIADADGDTKIQVEESSDEDLIRFDAAGVERFRIGSDVQVLAATDFNITGANRRLNFTSGSGTVRVTGASSLHLATNNTNRVTVDANGKVGIGTNSPAGVLEVNTGTGTSTANTVIIDRAASSSYSGVTFSTNGTEDWSIGQNSTGGFQIYENGLAATTRLTIKDGGNVGIGTNNPLYKLQVTGSIYANAGSLFLDSGQRLKWGNSQQFIEATNSGPMQFGTGNAERMRISNSGNVGIGSTAPDKLLVVQGAGAEIVINDMDTTDTPRLRFRESGTTSGTIHTDASHMMFSAGTTERMRIASGGDVGIGTTAPAFRFHVYHPTTNVVSRFESGDSQVWIDLHDSNSGTYGALLGHDGNNDQLFMVADQGVNRRFIIDNAGKVGIGNNVDPDKMLTVDGDVKIHNGDAFMSENVAGSTRSLISLGTDNILRIKGNDSEGSSNVLSMINGGNVGIGTTAPASKLDVIGDGKFRGTADGTAVLKLGQHSNSASTPLVTVYTDDDGTTRSFGGDSLEFNMSRYGQVIGATRGSAAGGNVRSWRFTTSSNGDERGVDLIIYSQGDSSATGSTATSGNVHLSAVSNRNSYINTSGNFGLGTASPATKLDVTTSGVNGLVLNSDTGTTTNSARLFFKASGGTVGMLNVNNSLSFRTGMTINSTSGTERLNINSTHIASTNTVLLKGANDNSGKADFSVNTGGGPTLSLYGGQVQIGASDMNWNGKISYIAGSGVYLSAWDNDLRLTTSGGASASARNIRFAPQASGGSSTERMIIKGDGNVGIGTSSPNAKLQVEELGIDTTTTTTSATTQVAIDTMAAATFRSAKYTIQVTNTTDSSYHVTEILLIHDGTTPGITEYGTVFTGSAAEATFDADISSGNVRLLATPASTDSMTFKVVRHCITV